MMYGKTTLHFSDHAKSNKIFWKKKIEQKRKRGFLCKKKVNGEKESLTEKERKSF